MRGVGSFSGLWGTLLSRISPPIRGKRSWRTPSRGEVSFCCGWKWWDRRSCSVDPGSPLTKQKPRQKCTHKKLTYKKSHSLHINIKITQLFCAVILLSDRSRVERISQQVGISKRITLFCSLLSSVYFFTYVWHSNLNVLFLCAWMVSKRPLRSLAHTLCLASGTQGLHFLV